MTEPGGAIERDFSVLPDPAGRLRPVQLATSAVARMVRLADTLFAWRCAERLSSLQAARRIGVSIGWYTMAETGQIDPGDVPPSTAMHLIQRTGLSQEKLGFAPDTDPKPADAGTAPLPAVPDGAPAAPIAAGAPLVGIRDWIDGRGWVVTMKWGQRSFALDADAAEAVAHELIKHAALLKAKEA
jgi:hypothetical protein